MTLRLTGVKVGLEDALDIQDALACLGYPDTTMCSGNRIIPSQYICPHCHKDNSAEKCGEPRNIALAKLKKEVAEGTFFFQLPLITEG